MMKRRRKRTLDERMRLNEKALDDAIAEIDSMLKKSDGLLPEHFFFSVMKAMRKRRVMKFFCEEVSDIPLKTLSEYRHEDRRERTELLVDVLDCLGYDLKVVKRE